MDNLKKDRLYWKRDRVYRKIDWCRSQNAKSYTKLTRANHKHAKPIARWTRANRRNEKNWKLRKNVKRGLVIALLKSKHSLAELFHNNFDNVRIRGNRKIPNELRDILAKEYKKEIKKKLYEIENKKIFSKLEKEKVNEYHTELVRILNKKEKYRYHDRDDLDYYGIRDIEDLFGEVDEKDYFKPILVKTAFKGNYKIYESRGNKDKNLSRKQYLYMIIPYLSDIINDHKATKLKNNKSWEWKTQLNIHINFFLLTILEKLVLLMYGVITKKFWWVMRQMILLKNFLNIF